MWMIPVLHVLGHGEVLKSVAPFSANYFLTWLLEVMAFCAVNCFALISGYVGYGRTVKYSNMICLALQALFYTVPITALFLCFSPDLVGIKTILYALFPYIYDTYWYLMSYFCMFFFIPVLNFLLEKLDRPRLIGLMAVIFVLAGISTGFHSDFGHTGYGYSAVWLAVLYLIGGYLRKYSIADKLAAWKCAVGYGACVLFTWLSKFVIDKGACWILGEPKGGTYLIRYTSPTILLCAVFLLLFFAKLSVKGVWKKLIAFFAPVSFGVYLIHEEPLIREHFITGRFAGYSSLPPLLAVLAVLGTAFGLWLVCSLIDRVRLALFDVLKVKEKCADLESFFRRRLGILAERFGVSSGSGDVL